mmetsp:Transcript_72769/g.229940  ORF Transcript_72769/g.229940 Transcript_72769/m.229940 type:complete len:90 (+) Transcript_72769:266-535(+)
MSWRDSLESLLATLEDLLCRAVDPDSLPDSLDEVLAVLKWLLSSCEHLERGETARLERRRALLTEQRWLPDTSPVWTICEERFSSLSSS